MNETGFHVLLKPIGPACNLACKYCYYLEKERLYPGRRDFRMPGEVLENFIRQYIAAQGAPEIPFAWQGGEPLLLGLGFFRRALELQRKYCPPGRRISNAIQTNGTLLDVEWCRFFRENGFLVGISIDGPRRLHDLYRLDKGGRPAFDKVMRGLELLVQHGVEFNTLTVVHRQNARQPLEVYSFLKRHGSRFMQFIPLVERVCHGQLLDRTSTAAGERMGRQRQRLPVAPPALAEAPDPVMGWEVSPAQDASVTPWSVEPLAYGEFLCAIFDEWLRHDVGEVYVQLFEVLLAMRLGLPSALCVFSETCGKGLALEHNGDLYACDHYVYPRHKLGNIQTQPLAELLNLPRQLAFVTAKRDKLPPQCRECDVQWACHGGCPKHRFVKSPDGAPGLNYLCPAYKHFFARSTPHISRLAALLRAGRPAAAIMLELSRKQEAARRVPRKGP